MMDHMVRVVVRCCDLLLLCLLSLENRFISNIFEPTVHNQASGNRKVAGLPGYCRRPNGRRSPRGMAAELPDHVATLTTPPPCALS